jgi:hypothetical protein
LVTAKQSLWDVDAPELVEVVGLDLGFHRGAAGSKAHVLGDQELLLLHDAIDALFVDRKAFPVFEIGPDAAVTPEGVLGLKINDSLKQRFVSFFDGHGSAP